MRLPTVFHKERKHSTSGNSSFKSAILQKRQFSQFITAALTKNKNKMRPLEAEVVLFFLFSLLNMFFALCDHRLPLCAI